MAAARMVGFGFKSGWLAVRDGRLPDVVDALGGRVAESTSWPEGIARIYHDEEIAIATPLLAGALGNWLLVAGQWIATHHESIDTAGLSGALGREVQLFVTHRVVEVHRWERAVGGALVRSFQYSGESDEVGRWHGDPDSVERAIGLPPVYDVNRGSALGGSVPSVKEYDLMRVAAAWSVDPTSLADEPATADLTVVQLPVARPAAARRSSDASGVVVDITDLIIAGEPYEVFQEKVAARLRNKR